MIELETQFQIVIISTVLGMVFTNLYTMFNILLRNSKVVRFVTELIYFCLASIFYYWIIYVVNDGILTIYMFVFLLVGYYIHMKFYDKHFSCLYKYLFSKIHCIIDIRREKWRRKWKEILLRKAKKQKSTE